MTLAEVNKQFDDLQAAVATEQKDVTAFIKVLNDKIAAGGVVTQAELDALGGKFAGLTKMVSDFDINTTAGPNPPPPIAVP